MQIGVMKKVILLLAMAGLIAAYFLFDLGRYMTLHHLGESRAQLLSLYEHHAALTVAAFMLAYIIVTALSIPVASFMGLAGGAIFGFIAGTMAVSLASTIGALLAFLASRYMFRGWAEKRIGGFLRTVNEGIEHEGALYLFSLRVIPVFPFWLINIAIGLTSMRSGVFFIVSLIGMLPGTMVFVNAGMELGKIESVAGIMSPGLIISFTILGLFPLAAKKAMNMYRKQRGRGPETEQ